MDLKDRITDRLSATGQTARGASLKAGLGADAIRIILSGRSLSPRAGNLSALAQALDCDVRYLLGEVDDAGSPPIESETPGQRLRMARRKAGRSAEDLAKAVGCSPSAVRNQENGTNGIPAAMAPLFAEQLGVTPEWILFGAGSPPAEREPRIQEGLSLTEMSGDKARLTMNKVLPFSVALQILALVQGDEK